MNIALIDVDGHHFPNLALMKLSAWHKTAGDQVEWYSPLFSNPERIYASKVFSFSPDYRDYNPAHPEPERGGTGYDLEKKLPPGKNKGRFSSMEYYISLDMAKELAMVENNARGRQARQYFIEVEKRYRKNAITTESIVAALTPVIRENEQFRAKLELARNFLPLGRPGELNKDGLPKNQFRRGCFVSRNGRNVSLLMENPSLPGIYEEIQVNLLNGTQQPLLEMGAIE